MYLWGIRSFFTGVGTTDTATEWQCKLWSKVPSAINLWITENQANMLVGKMLFYIIDKIGVDGVLLQINGICGDGIPHLTMDDRFTICNMATEAGAKNGIFLLMIK